MLTILAVSKQACLKLDEKPLLLKQLPVELLPPWITVSPKIGWFL
jgi:hypothetical protein